MKTILQSLFVVAFLLGGASGAFAQESQDVKYQGEFNVAYAICAAEDIRNPFNFETIHGIRINSHISVGLGLGVNVFADKAYDDDHREVLMPIFANVKWYILDGKVSPYVSLDMGYNVGVGRFASDYRGMYIAPGAGVSFKMKEKGAFNLGVALKNNELGAKYGKSVAYTSLAIKAAIVF